MIPTTIPTSVIKTWSDAIEYGQPWQPSASERYAIINWLTAEYNRLVYVEGYKFEEECVDNPYATIEDMCRDFTIHKKLMVSTKHCDHPLLTPEQNVMFRCVHDVHHYLCGADFSMAGECAAYLEACSTTDNPIVKQFLFSEIVLQAAYYFHNGTFLSEQRLVWYS